MKECLDEFETVLDAKCRKTQGVAIVDMQGMLSSLAFVRPSRWKVLPQLTVSGYMSATSLGGSWYLVRLIIQSLGKVSWPLWSKPQSIPNFRSWDIYLFGHNPYQRIWTNYWMMSSRSEKRRASSLKRILFRLFSMHIKRIQRDFQRCECVMRSLCSCKYISYF